MAKHPKPKAGGVARYKPPFPFFVLWLTLSYEKWHTLLIALMNTLMWFILFWIIFYNPTAPFFIILIASWLSGHLFVELFSEVRYLYNLYQSEKDDYLDRE